MGLFSSTQKIDPKTGLPAAIGADDVNPIAPIKEEETALPHITPPNSDFSLRDDASALLLAADEKSAFDQPNTTAPTIAIVPSTDAEMNGTGTGTGTGMGGRAAANGKGEAGVDPSGADPHDPMHRTSVSMSVVGSSGGSSAGSMGGGKEMRAQAFTWKWFKQRSTYYIPILGWMRYYSLKLLIDDISSGITVGLLLIPMAIAYAGLAMRTPMAGLITAFIPLVVYTFLGTSRQLSLGPEAITSTLFGQFVIEVADMDGVIGSGVPLHTYDDIAITLSFLVGVILLLLGLVRLGFLESVLSRPVMHGLVMAVAIQVMIQQMPFLLGFPPCAVYDDCAPTDSTIQRIGYLFHHINRANWRTVMIGISSLAFLFGMGYVKTRWSSQSVVIRHFPPTLALMIITILASWGLELHTKHGVAEMGPLTGGFGKPTLPTLSSDMVNRTLMPAAVIALLLFIEAFVIAKTYAAKHSYIVSPNRELVAIGAANLIGSCCLGYSAAGSFARSKVGDTAGSKTPVSQFVSALVVLLAILIFVPYFEHLPVSVLGAVVFVAVWGLLDLHELQFMWKIRAYKDVGLGVGMFLATLLLGVDMSIFIAFGVCLILLIKSSAVTHVVISVLGRAANNKDSFVDLSEDPEAEPVDGTLILRLEGPLHFANIGRIRELFSRVETFGDTTHHPSEEPQHHTRPHSNTKTDSHATPSAGANGTTPSAGDASAGETGAAASGGSDNMMQHTRLIVDLSLVRSVDGAATQAFVEIMSDFRSKSLTVTLVGVRTEIYALFVNAGLPALLGEHNFKQTLRDAVDS